MALKTHSAKYKFSHCLITFLSNETKLHRYRQLINVQIYLSLRGNIGNAYLYIVVYTFFTIIPCSSVDKINLFSSRWTQNENSFWDFGNFCHFFVCFFFNWNFLISLKIKFQFWWTVVLKSPLSPSCSNIKRYLRVSLLTCHSHTFTETFNCD